MHVTNRLPLLLLLPVLVVACRSTTTRISPGMEWSGVPTSAVDADIPSSTAYRPFPTLPITGSIEDEPMTEGSTEPVRYDNIHRRAGVRVGGVAYGGFDTSTQVRSENGLGAVIDFEDLLDVEESVEVFRFDAFYAFNDRHRLDASYYDLERRGFGSTENDLEIGPVIIPAGDTTTTMNTEIAKLAYRYNFVSDTRTVIGASFGLHVMGIDMSFVSGSFDVSQSLNATAPLPVLGLHGAYALSEKWSLYASGEVFQLELGEFGGTVSDFRLGLDWDVFEHVGLGIEMNSFNMGIDIEDGSLEADVEYGYQGIGIYLRGYL